MCDNGIEFILRKEVTNSFQYLVDSKFILKFKHSNLRNSDFLFHNNALDENFFIKNFEPSEFNEYLSYNSNLDVNFFTKYPQAFNLLNIIKNKNIPISYYEKEIIKILKIDYPNRDPLERLIYRSFYENAIITQEFIDENLELIDWDSISHNKNLSEPFIIKNLDKLILYQTQTRDITFNSKLSLQFFEDHPELINKYLLQYNRNLTVEFIEKYFVENNEFKNNSFNSLLNNEYAPISIFEKYIHLITDMELVACNVNITIDFIEKYINFIDNNETIISLAENPSIPESFFIKHKNTFSKYKEEISSNDGLSTKFFIENPEFISWDELLSNCNISPKFFKDNSNIWINLEGIEYYLLLKNDFSKYIKEGKEINRILQDYYNNDKRIKSYLPEGEEYLKAEENFNSLK